MILNSTFLRIFIRDKSIPLVFNSIYYLFKKVISLAHIHLLFLKHLQVSLSFWFDFSKRAISKIDHSNFLALFLQAIICLVDSFDKFMSILLYHEGIERIEERFFFIWKETVLTYICIAKVEGLMPLYFFHFDHK